MCGRYHISDEMLREVKKLIRQLDARLDRPAGRQLDARVSGSEDTVSGGRDIHPSEPAPVLCGDEGGGELCLKWGRWGFPGIQRSSVIFNARCETALEKPMFKESVRQRRAVVPAAWFYEWNKEKEKYSFYREESPALYMAGFLKAFEDGDHFVVLTTAANESMSQVHDRMPLLLEAGELHDWVWDAEKTRDILDKKPARLSKRADYEQLALPF